MISDKVRGNTRLPDGLTGDPEAVFGVSVLPTGEIAKVELLKSSGNPAYDKEVQRGIEKSSPLPVPTDRDAALQFRTLKLKHKAKE
jgi:colicin import membrane protein